MSEVQILLLLLLSGYLISVSLGMVIIPRILVISHKKRLYDVPDARKVHTMPVPRLGGLSFFPVILMSMFLVIGFRLYFWDMDTSSLSFNMLYEYLFLFVGMTVALLGGCLRTTWSGVGYRYKIRRAGRFGISVGVVRQLARLVGWPVRDLFSPGLAGRSDHGLRRGLRDERHQPD